VPPAVILKKLLVFAECFVLLSRLIVNPCRLIRVLQIISLYIRLLRRHCSVDINTQNREFRTRVLSVFIAGGHLPKESVKEVIVHIKFTSFDTSFRAVFAHLIPEYYVKLHCSFATFSECNCNYNLSL
jgi:hypothetical protein